jgi:hypothetical protein
MHQRVGVCHTRRKRAPIEDLANDNIAARGQSLLGSTTNERSHTVTAIQQSGDETAADVACATGHEDVTMLTVTHEPLKQSFGP